MNPFDQIEPTGGRRRVLGIVRRRALFVALVVALSAGGAYAYSKSQPTEYSSSSSLLFRDSALDQKLFGASFIAPSRDPRREAATNERLVISPVVARMTAQELGGDTTSAEVLRGISVATQGESNLVRITGTAGTPEGAQALANTYAEQFIRHRRDAERAKIRDARELVEGQIAELRRNPVGRADQRRILQERSDQLQILSALQTGNVELAQPGGKPRVPSAPRTRRNTILGGFLGLLLGAAIAFVLEALDRRIRDVEEVETIYETPTLAVLPYSSGLQDDMTRLPAPDAELFRLLRTRLRYFNVDREVKVLLVTSEAPAEGKSTVSWHLARVAAEMASEDGQVLLLEADLRRPTIATRLQQPAGIGLADVLTHRATIEEAILTVAVSGTGDGTGRNGAQRSRSLHVMTAGAIPPNPAELCESARMREVLAALRESYSFVVIDAPPATIVSDTISLMGSVDGVVVVSRLGVATRRGGRGLRRQLAELNAPLLGVVINGAGRDDAPYYAYRGYRDYLATAHEADVEQPAQVSS